MLVWAVLSQPAAEQRKAYLRILPEGINVPRLLCPVHIRPQQPQQHRRVCSILSSNTSAMPQLSCNRARRAANRHSASSVCPPSKHKSSHLSAGSSGKRGQTTPAVSPTTSPELQQFANSKDAARIAQALIIGQIFCLNLIVSVIRFRSD